MRSIGIPKALVSHRLPRFDPLGISGAMNQLAWQSSAREGEESTSPQRNVHHLCHRASPHPKLLGHQRIQKKRLQSPNQKRSAFLSIPTSTEEVGSPPVKNGQTHHRSSRNTHDFERKRLLQLLQPLVFRPKCCRVRNELDLWLRLWCF